MIHGLTPSLAEGGKIKIGSLGAPRPTKGGGTFRPPTKLDHFRLTTTIRDAAGDLIEDAELMAMLPVGPDGKCREIPIVLHDDEIDMVFPTSYALYTGRKLFCHGDGETAVRYEIKNGQRTGAAKELECPCPYLGAKEGPICKPHGTLHCSIRVPGKAVAGSVYKWRTTSMISIQRMIGSLQQILAVTGTLTGIPLVLKLEPIQVSPPNAPASTVYCCHVELRAADLMDVQRQALAAAQMRDKVRHAVTYRALLAAPAGDDEDDDEAADVQQEFHPEPPEPTPPLVEENGTQRHVAAPEPEPAVKQERRGRHPNDCACLKCEKRRAADAFPSDPTPRPPLEDRLPGTALPKPEAVPVAAPKLEPVVVPEYVPPDNDELF